jgi:hypothetical protein
MLQKKSWEIQDGFKYKLPTWLGCIFTFFLMLTFIGILNNIMMSIFVGGIGCIGGGIGTWVDYTVKKKKSLGPKPQTKVEVRTDLLHK